ncbi:MAG: phage tail tape measure protein [Thermodesulfobacteriota bacterium]
MLAQVGAKFSLEGIEAAMSKLRNLSGAFSGLNRTVGNEASQFQRKTQMMSQSVDKLAHQIKRSMSMAKTAMAGALAGRAAQSLLGLGAGPKPPGVGAKEDFLRLHGAKDDDLKAMREQSRNLGRKIPRFDEKAFVESWYTLAPKFQRFGKQAVASAQEVMADLGVVLGQNADAAAKFYSPMHAMFAAAKTPEEQQRFPEQLTALQLKAQQEGDATPHDIMAGLTNVGPVFAAAGKSIDEAYAEMVAVVVAAGGGEKGGTAMKNISARPGEIYAKMQEEYALAREETERGRKHWQWSGDEKKEWAGKKADNEERWQEVGGGLFARDTEKYFETMNYMIETMKSVKPDAMDRIGKAVGLESVSVFLNRALMGKTGEVARLKKEFQGATQNPGQAREDLTNSFQSAESKIVVFQQKIGQLWTEIGRTRNALATHLLGPWGDAVSRLTDMWVKFGGGITANAEAFFGSLKSGFLSSLGYSTNLEQTLGSIIETLGKPDPTKWQQLGEQLGSIAGTTLGPLVASVQELAAALGPIVKMITTIGNGLGYLGDLVTGDSWVNRIAGNDMAQLMRLKGKPAGPDDAPAGKVSRRHVGGASAAMEFFGPGKIPEWYQVGMRQRMAEGALSRPTPPLQRVAEPSGPVMPSPAGSAGPGLLGMQSLEQQAKGLFSAPPINVEAPQVQSQVQVYLDGSEIAARVKEQISSDGARKRFGAGDTFLGGM